MYILEAAGNSIALYMNMYLCTHMSHMYIDMLSYIDIYTYVDHIYV